jgi:general secretion pathway protein H
MDRYLRQSQSRRAAARGLTLIEVLIVVALIALLSGTVLFGSGLFASNRERSAATLILTGVRLGLTRANATGKPVRMVFDLEKNRVKLEEAKGVMLLKKDDGESTGAGAEPATQAEREAKKEADRIMDGPKPPRPRFKPVKDFGGDSEHPGDGRELGRGITFRSVQTSHDGEPRKEGRAYLYFWPGGGTERASIQIQSSPDDKGLTILVSPLTGRAEIKRGHVALEEPRTDSDFGERKSEEEP